MIINELTATLRYPEDLRVLDGWVAAANAMGQTPDDFLLTTIQGMGREFADRYKVGVMPSSEFLLRFTPEEIGAIMTAAETDENIAALLAEVRREANVAADDPRVGPGLQYLVSTGLLAEERMLEVTAYPRPVPRDFEAEVDPPSSENLL